MTTLPLPTVVAAGVRLVREDGTVLLVRHRTGVAAGRWCVPIIDVPEDEVMESAVVRLLRDVLRLDPGRIAFAETLRVPAPDGDVLVNVFDAFGWAGEPRYSDRDFDDAGWVEPAAMSEIDALPELAAWLGRDGTLAESDPHDELALELLRAREDVLAAFEAIDRRSRERALDAAWAPVDVLHHLAVYEAYAMDETLRMIEQPGHRWRPFSEAQAEAERRLRPRPSEAEVRDRIVRGQSETVQLLGNLMPEQFRAYGTHIERGLLTARDCIEEIARHDREHADQLRAMHSAVERAAL